MNDRPTEEEPGRPFLVAGQWWWRGQRVWWAHRRADGTILDVAAVVVDGPAGSDWVLIEAQRESGERVRVHASPWRLRQR